MAPRSSSTAWGLRVPPNDDPQPGNDLSSPAPSQTREIVRITMAAIDPGEKWQENLGVEPGMKQRATLKMIILDPPDDSDDEDDDYDDGAVNVADLLGEDSDDDESDDQVNGGPSNPEKTPKARKKEALMKVLTESSGDIDVDEPNAINGMIEGKPKDKGKSKAMDQAGSVSDGSEDDEMSNAKEFVVCTLDPDQHYQQTLDISIPSFQPVLFTVTGTHSVHLTGSVTMTVPESMFPGAYDSEDQDEGMDLSPDEDELDLPDEDESDELDDLEDPRIREVSSDDEHPPKLIKTKPEAKRGKNKRAAEDSPEDTPQKPTTDSILSKSLKPADASEPLVNGEQKLSKKEQKKMRKKMKDNAGKPVEVATTTLENEDKGIKAEAIDVTKNSPGKTDKKVSFASTLIQGPSSALSPNPDSAKEQMKTVKVEPQNKSGTDENSKPPKPTLGTKTVQGVTIEDRKLGDGQLAKKGDKVSMRYVGKLEADKRVFDSNKKGTPFTFKIGSGEVIKGWDIGVTGMAVTGERRITIPPHLAYGPKGQGKDIPPNSTLVFDLKVLDIR